VLALLGALAALIVWQVEPGSQPLLLGLAALGLGVALLWSLPFVLDRIGPYLIAALILVGIVQAIIDL
jgi:tryptophan-rich sensory protein